MGAEDVRTARRVFSAMPVRQVQLVVRRGPDAGKTAALEAHTLSIGTDEGNDLVLTDQTVSRFHLELRRAGDHLVLVDHGSTNGTRVGPVSLRGTEVAVRPECELELGETAIEVRDGAVASVERGQGLGGLRSRAPEMDMLLSRAAKVAPTEASVLLLGESGTGKELIARAIYEASARAEGPFVTVDCGALSPGLFASELFGHERGAFTGADRRHIGAFERASGGTLFLDEIAELPREMQAALLGVLERRSFRRLGGTEDLHADVRLISATHGQLHAAVNAGRFRLDLFHRVAVVRLRVPPLRERLEDLPALLDALLRDHGDARVWDEVFAPEVLDQIRAHPWPGNVRELRNFVHAAVALGEPPELLDAGANPGGDVIDAVLDHPYRAAKERVVESFERRYLARLLERSRHNVRHAARVAQMNRGYLLELLAKHGHR